MKNKVYPCLWFDNNAREAAELYSRAFHGTKIVSDNQMVVMVESSGQRLMLLNGGPVFKINPSISFYTVFEDEGELKNSWSSLIEGGTALMPLGKYPWSTLYGWVSDRYGVNWQLYAGKREHPGQVFAPALMFTGNQNGSAGKAIGFYTSLFKNSSVKAINRYEKGDGDTEGNIKHAQFFLEDRLFVALESSLMHNFSFNEAVSVVVECADQAEIDYLWDNLTRGGEESRCGWLKDQFGVSWQIIPAVLSELMSDPEKAGRVMQAFLKMNKFDIDALLKA